jgi:hypothetical protein
MYAYMFASMFAEQASSLIWFAFQVAQNCLSLMTKIAEAYAANEIKRVDLTPMKKKLELGFRNAGKIMKKPAAALGALAVEPPTQPPRRGKRQVAKVAQKPASARVAVAKVAQKPASARVAVASKVAQKAASAQVGGDEEEEEEEEEEEQEDAQQEVQEEEEDKDEQEQGTLQIHLVSPTLMHC